MPDSLPLQALQRYRSLTDDWPAFVDALSSPLPLCVWTNTRRLTPSALQALLHAEGITATPLDWMPGGFRLPGVERIGDRWWYLAGLCHAQEEASMLPVQLLAPQQGERILDLCAAPGGKAAQIAVALGEHGTLVANDVNGERIRGLRGNLERLGLENVSITRRDGTGFPNAAGGFDRVLVDAPCSAEGTLRKRSRSLGTHGLQGPGRHAGRQLALLRRAVALCRPGGRIVYSTCTFAPEENELVIDALLRETAPWVTLTRAELPGLVTSPGITAWQGAELDERLRRAHRVWPHQNDTGGFFATVLEKRSDAPLDKPSALPETLTAVQAPELGPGVVDRFGIDPAVLERWPVSRRSGRGLYVTNRSHRPPAAPPPETTGLRLLRTSIRPPKLSTAGAMLLAPYATRNVVELERGQLDAFFHREELYLKREQVSGCNANGYAIATHRGHGLGTLVVDVSGRRARSLFPKRWTGWTG